MKFESAYKSREPDDAGYIHYEPVENKTWQKLIEKQQKTVKNYACQPYLDGLNLLNLPSDRIPQCHEINKVLSSQTGWKIEPVPALIPYDQFFSLLSQKKFPAATFIRKPESIEYLKEPDIFHEIFGHCPLLTNKIYADFMHEYGKLGLRCNEFERARLARFYWFTVEFGLIKTEQGVRCYGGGILSSPKETVYALENPQAQRLPYDIIDILRTPYRIDILQPVYYVIDNFEQLYDVVNENLLALISKAHDLGEFSPRFEVD